MASGDTVFEVLGATCLKASTGQRLDSPTNYTVTRVDLAGPYSPGSGNDVNVVIRDMLLERNNSAIAAIFDVTKSYDIRIKEH